jgi:hypothetical protein
MYTVCLNMFSYDAPCKTGIFDAEKVGYSVKKGRVLMEPF